LELSFEQQLLAITKERSDLQSCWFSNLKSVVLGLPTTSSDFEKITGSSGRLSIVKKQNKLTY
jgi:hypothetical protein